MIRTQRDKRNEWMLNVAARLRDLIAERGMSQEQVEIHAGFAHGTVSRILNARHSRLRPETISRLAGVFKMTSEELLRGLPVNPNGEVADPPRTLAEIEGWDSAMIQVARLEPNIPLHVFDEAKRTVLRSPPEVITAEFLRGYVCFLAEHLFADGQTISGVREKAKPASASSEGRKKRSG